MGRKRRLDKKQHVKSEQTTSTATQSIDTAEDADEDEVIPLPVILAQQGSDKEYLRLRNLRGHLPLSFYTHFQSLRILNLRNCDIKALAPQVTQLTRLRHVDVTGNHGIQLPCQLSRCNLTRFIHSDSLLRQEENDKVPHSPILNRQYCGDKEVHKVPMLTRMCAQVIIETCDLDQLEAVQNLVPAHLKAYLQPSICAECGAVGRRIVARRIRKAVVAFNTVPLHYDLCSPTCLARIQEVWKLEELLNNEKRALRLQKFGRLNEVTSYSYA